MQRIAVTGSIPPKLLQQVSRSRSSSSHRTPSNEKLAAGSSATAAAAAPGTAAECLGPIGMHQQLAAAALAGTDAVSHSSRDQNFTGFFAGRVLLHSSMDVLPSTMPEQQEHKQHHNVPGWEKQLRQQQDIGSVPPVAHSAAAMTANAPCAHELGSQNSSDSSSSRQVLSVCADTQLLGGNMGCGSSPTPTSNTPHLTDTTAWHQLLLQQQQQQQQSSQRLLAAAAATECYPAAVPSASTAGGKTPSAKSAAAAGQTEAAVAASAVAISIAGSATKATFSPGSCLVCHEQLLESPPAAPGEVLLKARAGQFSSSQTERLKAKWRAVNKPAAAADEPGHIADTGSGRLGNDHGASAVATAPEANVVGVTAAGGLAGTQAMQAVHAADARAGVCKLQGGSKPAALNFYGGHSSSRLSVAAVVADGGAGSCQASMIHGQMQQQQQQKRRWTRCLQAADCGGAVEATATAATALVPKPSAASGHQAAWQSAQHLQASRVLLPPAAGVNLDLHPMGSVQESGCSRAAVAAAAVAGSAGSRITSHVSCSNAATVQGNGLLRVTDGRCQFVPGSYATATAAGAVATAGTGGSVAAVEPASKRLRVVHQTAEHSSELSADVDCAQQNGKTFVPAPAAARTGEHKPMACKLGPQPGTVGGSSSRGGGSTGGLLASDVLCSALAVFQEQQQQQRQYQQQRQPDKAGSFSGGLTASSGQLLPLFLPCQRVEGSAGAGAAAVGGGCNTRGDTAVVGGRSEISSTAAGFNHVAQQQWQQRYQYKSMDLLPLVPSVAQLRHLSHSHAGAQQQLLQCGHGQYPTTVLAAAAAGNSGAALHDRQQHWMVHPAAVRQQDQLEADEWSAVCGLLTLAERH